MILSKKTSNLTYGDDSFLTESTAATLQLWDQVLELSRLERELGGVPKMDPIPYQPLYLMDPDINKKLKKWSISKLNPLSIHCSLLAYFEWHKLLAKLMSTKLSLK